jgi:drug/metabolite transporter (DMT)-like permease
MIPTDWISVSFLGIIQIGIAYAFYIKGVIGSTRPVGASIIGVIEPFLNSIWVFMFVGTRPNGWALLGGFVIVLTIVHHTGFEWRNERVTQ